MAEPINIKALVHQRRIKQELAALQAKAAQAYAENVKSLVDKTGSAAHPAEHAAPTDPAVLTHQQLSQQVDKIALGRFDMYDGALSQELKDFYVSFDHFFTDEKVKQVFDKVATDLALPDNIVTQRKSGLDYVINLIGKGVRKLTTPRSDGFESVESDPPATRYHSRHHQTLAQIKQKYIAELEETMAEINTSDDADAHKKSQADSAIERNKRAYLAAINDYYKRLLEERDNQLADAIATKEVDNKKTLETLRQTLIKQLIDEAISDERVAAQRELTELRERQRARTYGQRLTKWLFAPSMGFFAAGGWYLLLAGAVPMPLLLMISGVFFLFPMTMNYKTTINEMGDLIYDLFFNQEHATLSWSERFRRYLAQTEISPAAAVRTVKGSTNLFAASTVGFLTFLGSLSVMVSMYFANIPTFSGITFSSFLGVAGPTLLIVASSALLALAATLVYFTITNIYQHKQRTPEQKQLITNLGKLTNTPNADLKFKVKLGFVMFGMVATLSASYLPLVELLSGTALAAVPAVLYLLPAIAVLGAIFGIMSFYVHRTRQASIRDAAVNAGTRIEMDRFFTDDLTGRAMYDAEQYRPAIGLFEKMGRFLTYISPYGRGIGVITPRFVNAIAQIGVSIIGAYYLPAFLLGLIPGALGVGVFSFTLVAFIAGGLAGIATLSSAWSSLNANNIEEPHVEERVPELATCEEECLALQSITQAPTPDTGIEEPPKDNGSTNPSHVENLSLIRSIDGQGKKNYWGIAVAQTPEYKSAKAAVESTVRSRYSFTAGAAD